MSELAEWDSYQVNMQPVHARMREYFIGQK